MPKVTAMRSRRPQGAKRFLASMLAAIAVAIVSGGQSAAAFTNPFSIGNVDEISCAPTPILHLAIANNGSVASSQNGAQWTNPTLYVAYLQGDGATYYPIKAAPLPNIAAGNQATLDIPIERIDKTFVVAIHATDPAGNTLKLLTGTTITPELLCATAEKGGKAAQSPSLKTSTPDAPDAPTALHFAAIPLLSGQRDLEFAYGQPQQVDGYRLYRTAHGTRAYVSSLAGPTALRRVFRIAKATAGDCYDVVAVRHSIESAASTSVCFK